MGYSRGEDRHRHPHHVDRHWPTGPSVPTPVKAPGGCAPPHLRRGRTKGDRDRRPLLGNVLQQVVTRSRTRSGRRAEIPHVTKSRTGDTLGSRTGPSREVGAPRPRRASGVDSRAGRGPRTLRSAPVVPRRTRASSGADPGPRKGREKAPRRKHVCWDWAPVGPMTRNWGTTSPGRGPLPPRDTRPERPVVARKEPRLNPLVLVWVRESHTTYKGHRGLRSASDFSAGSDIQSETSTSSSPSRPV